MSATLSPDIFPNPHISSPSPAPSATTPHSTILAFHRSLPSYAPSPLIPLPPTCLPSPQPAAAPPPLVFAKLSSPTLGLPAFKILGATWAVYRALCARLALPRKTVGFAGLRDALAAGARRFRLVAASEGNWGRATARTAALLGVGCTVFVPRGMSRETEGLIAGEGARVVTVEGEYDDVAMAARVCAEDDEGVGEEEGGAEEAEEKMLCMDVGWDGYEEFPRWVTEGYATMLLETDAQLRELLTPSHPPHPTHVAAAVGVGSWAHAVTQYYRPPPPPTTAITSSAAARPLATVLAVEPRTAPALHTSLRRGEMTSVSTSESIMCGMNCGTPSTIAWPVLRAGVGASVLVGEWEAHEATEWFRTEGQGEWDVGPCGGATLAAVRRVAAAGGEGALKLDGESVVVLFCTEGRRGYEVPAEDT